MTIRNKVKCSICGREISKSNIAKHETACKSSRKETTYSLTHEGLDCQFCGKTCKNKNSLCNHERLCKLNPNRQQGVGFTSFNKARKAGEIQTWNKGLTKEESASLKKQSETLAQWYLDHPLHTIGGLRETSARACKFGTYKDFYCDSGWELAFLIYQLDHNKKIERCKQSFNYEYQGKVHKYYPDFIIDGVYYEIKGIYRDADYAKIAQFPVDKTLVVIDKKSIYPFTRYCEKHYGKNYTELYDRTKPSWLDLKDPTKQYNFNILE